MQGEDIKLDLNLNHWVNSNVNSGSVIGWYKVWWSSTNTMNYKRSDGMWIRWWQTNTDQWGQDSSPYFPGPEGTKRLPEYRYSFCNDWYYHT